MKNSEFVSLHTGTGSGKSVHGEHYFRKSAVTYFGIAEHRLGQDDPHGKNNPYFRAKITYATSGSTADTLVLDMEVDTAFKEFINQMLDQPVVNAEETDRISNRVLHANTPEEPEEEPAFVTRDCLEITEGSEEFFKWLHGKFYNSEKIDCWSFKAVPGTQDEDFIVCHKPNTSTSPADVHIAFRNHFKYARVCGIVVNDHYTPDDVGFNFILHEFVRDIVRPYADIHKITYSYTGTPNEQPLKSNGTPENTNTDTLDSLEITGEAEGFYAFLLAKATSYMDLGGKWSVSRDDDKFTCKRIDDDTMNSFTVTLSFTHTGRYARVTAIEPTGTALTVDMYNRFLRRFVSELVKPYAEIQKLTYEYSGKC
jgi:hypothetical protein